MNKLWALTKVLLKTNLLGGSSKNQKKSSKYFGIIGIGLLLVFVVCSLGVPIIIGLDSILEVVVNIEDIMLSLILPLAGVTTVIFSIFSVVSVFYLSKDSDYLLPMPIKSRDIMLSKFLVSMVNEYYILFMFILPCLIGVGVGINAGVMYYIYMIVVFLLLPIIPSTLVTLIILLVTRFTGIIKNKDVFMYVSMALILAFAFGYNCIIQNVISINPDNIGTTIDSLKNAILPYFRLIFPFYNSAVDALLRFNDINGIFSLMAFIAFNFIALVILYLVGDKLYLRTLIVNRGSKKKDENIECSIEENSPKNKGSFYWLLKKEWLVVKRTPVFMLNIVIIVFLMPVIFVVSFIFGYASNGEESLSLPQIEKVHELINEPIFYLIVMAIALFFTCSSLAASTSISREGGSAWYMKVIPVSYFKQITAKVFFAVLLDLLSIIVVAIVPVIMYKIPLLYVLSMFIPVTLIVIIINYFNIWLDLRKPHINWSEESVAVKQNLSGFISVLFTIAVSVIFGILAFLLYYFDISINVYLLAVIISVLCGLLLALVICIFYKKSNDLLEKID